jgi:hypothetical protein
MVHSFSRSLAVHAISFKTNVCFLPFMTKFAEIETVAYCFFNIYNKVVLAQSLTPCMIYKTGKKHLDYQTLINKEEQINRLTDTQNNRQRLTTKTNTDTH